MATKKTPETTDNKPEYVIKDSGNRTNYSTGAVRDLKSGKGRFDLVPIWVMGYAINDEILIRIGKFVDEKEVRYLFDAIKIFCEKEAIAPYEVLLSVSRHFEEGAKKYAPRNWEKGISISSYIDSAVRHYCKHKNYDQDEPHGTAFIWNLICLIETIKRITEGKLPETLLDLPGFDTVAVYDNLRNQFAYMRSFE